MTQSVPHNSASASTILRAECTLRRRNRRLGHEYCVVMYSSNRLNCWWSIFSVGLNNVCVMHTHGLPAAEREMRACTPWKPTYKKLVNHFDSLGVVNCLFLSDFVSSSVCIVDLLMLLSASFYLTLPSHTVTTYKQVTYFIKQRISEVFADKPNNIELGECNCAPMT